MSFLSKALFNFTSRRTITSFSSFSPLGSLFQRNTTPRIMGLPQAATNQASSLLLHPFGMTSQRRWKSRGNTFQPSTLKRKRRIGFLARAKSKQGSKILLRRKAKGRWYLTH